MKLISIAFGYDWTLCAQPYPILLAKLMWAEL